jgi:hypothetical protein
MHSFSCYTLLRQQPVQLTNVDHNLVRRAEFTRLSLYNDLVRSILSILLARNYWLIFTWSFISRILDDKILQLFVTYQRTLCDTGTVNALKVTTTVLQCFIAFSSQQVGLFAVLSEVLLSKLRIYIQILN